MKRKESKIKSWYKMLIGYIGLYFYNRKHRKIDITIKGAMTAKEIAKELGRSVPYYYMIKSGERKLSAGNKKHAEILKKLKKL